MRDLNANARTDESVGNDNVVSLGTRDALMFVLFERYLLVLF